MSYNKYRDYKGLNRGVISTSNFGQKSANLGQIVMTQNEVDFGQIDRFARRRKMTVLQRNANQLEQAGVP